METPAWLASFADAVFGNPIDAALAPKPVSYEDVHADVQSILIPPTNPKGLSLAILQPFNRNFALQHKCVEGLSGVPSLASERETYLRSASELPLLIAFCAAH
jgi:hypothetical protein